MYRTRKSNDRCDSVLTLSKLGALSIILIALVLSCAEKPEPLPLPETRRDDVTEVIHGVEIVDPYRWLEGQEDKETREWIDAQNAYAHSYIDHVPGRKKLAKRLTQLMKTDRLTMPMARDGRYFLYKRLADDEQWIIYMREGLEGEDVVLIDPHPMSPDHSTSVSLLNVSKDGTLLAYGIQEGGEDEEKIRLFDVDGKRDLPEELPKARYHGTAIKPDKSGLYYTRHGEEGGRVYYHEMGTNPADDVEIFGKGYGPDKIIYTGLSEDGSYLLIHVMHGWSKSEIHYQDLIKGGPIRTLVKGIDANFFGTIADNTLYMQTNWKAPRGRIMAVDLNHPSRRNWKELIPEGKGVIEYFTMAGQKLFINTLENVVSKVKVYEPSGEYIRDISFPTLGTVGGVSGRWESDEAFFMFTSFHVPTTIYRYEVSEGKQEVWTQLDVDVKTEDIEVKQVWYESKDGTEVPMFVVHKKDIMLDGTNPTLLTGYGGFNASLTPYFAAEAIVWLEHGGLFATPNLRGGGEFGEEWHEAGMFENKQNVFDDFIAAAEWLIDKKYTSPQKLAIVGGSNGGLLVGAAMTQRPDLFGAVVCTYPLLDMVRYHKFLVARFWVAEYGSAENPDQFKYIYEYSPYHNVKEGTAYPAVLFITGDADTRVAPLHARKMTALMQSATASEKPVLLLYDTKTGHSGGRPVSKQIEDVTDEMSFLLWQLGMK